MDENRDAWIEIDLGNLEKNIQVIQNELLDSSAGSKLCALMGVVKADAYGHGAVAVAEILQAKGVSWLGVASVDEGRQLRLAGIHLPILVLAPCPQWSMAKAIDFSLDVAVTSLPQLERLASYTIAKNKSCFIHLKIDTGMHRLGFLPQSYSKLFQILSNHPQIKVRGIFSHLAKADDLAETRKQDVAFKNAIKVFEQEGHTPQCVHLASSEAARRFPFVRYDMVRVGLHLYGLHAKTKANDLEPVMSVRGRINQLSFVEEGEAVGYGLTWRAQRRTRLAVLPIGYADGVDRRLSNKMKGLIKGNFVNQVGTISMDQMSFDVTDIEDVAEGDVITIIGSQYHGNRYNQSGLKAAISIADWACASDTITYELVCRLKLRLPRVFSRARMSQSICPGDLA